MILSIGEPRFSRIGSVLR